MLIQAKVILSLSKETFAASQLKVRSNSPFDMATNGRTSG